MSHHPLLATPPHTASRHRALGLALGTALALGACKKDTPADEAGEATAGAAEGARKDAQSPRPEASKGAPAKAAASLPNMAPAAGASGVFGHVLIPDGAGFLEAVQEHLAVPQFAPFVNEGFLRGIAASQLESRGTLAQNVRLDAPMGCAVLSPKEVDMPAVCVVGYRGGLEQLLKDLGDAGKEADAQGHAAHYKLEGKSVYLDEIGAHVAISGHPQALAKAKTYIEQQLLARADQAAGQIEIVIYPGAIAKAYQEEVRPLLDLMQQGASEPKTGDPDLDRAFAVWSKENQASTRRFFEDVLAMEQASAALDVADAGSSLRISLAPAAGSEFAKEIAAAQAGAIDPAFAGAVPKDTMVLVATSQNREGALATPRAQDSMRALGEAYAAFARRDPKATADAFTSYMERITKTYGEQAVMAVVHAPDKPFGVVMVQQTKASEAVVRALWDEIAKKATPEALLPKKLQGKVTWSYGQGPSVGGVTADRFTFELIGDAAKAMDEGAAKEKSVGKLKDWLGGSWKIVIDRALTDGRMYVVFAPGAEEAYMQAVFAAKGGGAAALGPAVMERASARLPGVNLFAGVQMGGLLDLVREIAPPSDAAKIPKGLGKDVDDLAISARRTADDGLEMEIFVSQPFIDRVRKVVQQQAQGQ